MKYNVLVVDDDPYQLHWWTAVVQRGIAQARILTAGSIATALQVAAQHELRAVITDFHLAGEDVNLLLDGLSAKEAASPPLVVAVSGDVDALALGVPVILKPLSLKAAQTLINALVVEIPPSREELAEMVGRVL